MAQNYYSLNEHVCNFISEQIFSGKMQPGEKISENVLSEMLNVSRTPIREALIQLASEGLIAKTPRKGFYTKKIKVEEAREIYHVMGLLDADAARLAVDVIDDETLIRLSKIYDQLCIAIKYQDLRLYKDLQKEFHTTYIALCGNKTLISMLDHLKFIVDTQMYYIDDKNKLFAIFQSYNEDHQLIIQYFREKNKAALTKLLTEKHWRLKYTEIIRND